MNCMTNSKHISPKEFCINFDAFILYNFLQKKEFILSEYEMLFFRHRMKNSNQCYIKSEESHSSGFVCIDLNLRRS